jgi:hypothetical protein
MSSASVGGAADEPLSEHAAKIGAMTANGS